MDGKELIRKVRNLDQHLPVIVMTGDLGQTETLTDEFDQTSTTLLRKPVSLSEIEAAIVRMLAT
jgi:DNA-binding response OmpR family regulator